MARKKAPPAPPKPSPDRVQQAIDRGDPHGAYLAAKLLHANEPSPAHLALLKSTLAAAALVLESTGKLSEFNKLMGEADQIDPANAEWRRECACLLARGGRLADALMRVDESDRLRVLGHGADRALKSGSKEFLPDELHAGFDAVVAAFGGYEAGDDEAARAALEPIGLRSPFLEWKVLLRGLMAFAARDDARAAENFARLDRTRIPFRLCGPYFAVADPAYKASLPGPVAAELAKRFASLNSGTIEARFREMAQHLGREKPLTPVFSLVETLLPRLKKDSPALVGKLAKCLYHAIIRQGQPEDLARYRQLFGPLADDPQYFRLQARIAEEIGQIGVSNQNWIKYEEWLATKPAGWSEPLLNRVRAMIWHHMAMVPDPGLDLQELMPQFAQALFTKGPLPELKKGKPVGPSPLECLRRAAELAPDWDEAARDLFNDLVEAEEHAEAERVGRTLLAHHPNNPQPLLSLATLLSKQNRPAEAIELLLRARAADPLNETIAIHAAHAVVALARTKLAAKDPTEAERIFDKHHELVESVVPILRDAVLFVMAHKLGDERRMDALLEKLSVSPSHRLAVPYQIAVDSQVAKLKPADRKAADVSFADALEQVPAPIEVYFLLNQYDNYLDEGVAYRGQKTQLKKFLALVPRTLGSPAPERDFETLAERLLSREEFKLAKKYAQGCIDRFPRNPVFRVVLAEAAIELEERPYRINMLLTVARSYVVLATEPRHKALLPRIEERMKENPDPMAFMDSFFDRY
ncbi:MAG: tetratricopeptide repeat protein [Gemmataceae bacterium]